MIDNREGETKKAPKQQGSYFNDEPAMPSKGNVQPSQRKAPKQVGVEK